MSDLKFEVVKTRTELSKQMGESKEELLKKLSDLEGKIDKATEQTILELKQQLVGIKSEMQQELKRISEQQQQQQETIIDLRDQITALTDTMQQIATVLVNQGDKNTQQILDVLQQFTHMGLATNVYKTPLSLPCFSKKDSEKKDEIKKKLEQFEFDQKKISKINSGVMPTLKSTYGFNLSKNLIDNKQ